MEANSTGGQGSSRAVAPSDDDEAITFKSQIRRPRWQSVRAPRVMNMAKKLEVLRFLVSNLSHLPHSLLLHDVRYILNKSVVC
jgi:hypothetical protein